MKKPTLTVESTTNGIWLHLSHDDHGSFSMMFGGAHEIIEALTKAQQGTGKWTIKGWTNSARSKRALTKRGKKL